MRKVIASINVTLDGYMSGPNCELDWHFEKWGPDLARAFGQQLADADTILLGRVTYSAMARYWPQKAYDYSFSREDIAFADMMNSYNKIVFTKTLTEPSWSNTRLVSGSLKTAIQKLKKQRGKDMIIYGSGKLIDSMVQLQLIDEYVLWIHPVILGRGKALFQLVSQKLPLQLIRTHHFQSGVVMLCYEPLRQQPLENSPAKNPTVENSVQES